MQRAGVGRYDNVHVPGTLGARDVRYEGTKNHGAGGHLCVWVGHLPGRPAGVQDICRFDIYFSQVLTGEIPFPEIQDTAMGYHVLRGKRPEKPENAPAIGFSDSMWRFTQRCWDGTIESRPEAGEVVAHLGEAAAKWDGLMPPSFQTDNVASCSEEETSDSEFGEFNISTLPLCCPPSHGTDGLFLSSSSDFPESPVESETSSIPFNRQNLPPTQRDEHSQKGSREAITKLFRQLQT